MSSTRLTSLAATALLLAPLAASAQPASVELPSELQHAISSLIIADTNAAHGTIAPRLLAPQYATNQAAYTGVVRIFMKDSSGAALGSCSGSLFAGGRAILTAAHCVANTSGPNSGKLVAGNADLAFRSATGETVVMTNAASVITVKPGYTGSVVEKNDLAVIMLNRPAPSFATVYSLFSGNALNQTATFAGWGLVGDGNIGDYYGTGNPGWRLQGNNRWEATREGNSLYSAAVDSRGILVYDFDNGSLNRNTLCNVFYGPNAALAQQLGLELCNTGFGEGEVALGRGDSGGPGFINVGTAVNPIFQIAGVASWVTGGNSSAGGACPSQRVSCFGAIGGHVDLAYGDNIAWAYATAAPEPGTWALLATGLVLLGGVAARRRRAEG